MLLTRDIIEKLLHERFIISSDPALNGDLLCGEIDPKETVKQVLTLFLLWTFSLITIVVNNKCVHKKLGRNAPSPGD